MGREATCHAEWPGGAGEVRALLETHEIFLRGARREHLQLAALTDIVAHDDALTFTSPAGRYALHLGATAAASWAKKIATPPPTLAAKLGITTATKVRVLGVVDDAALQAAIATGSAAGQADLTIAVVTEAAELAQAVEAPSPLWLAYVKGPKSPLGEAAIRAAMREGGWIDVKTASVSDRLTATKFTRR